MPEDNDAVPGTPELIKWFGYMPSFHDAEVLDLKLTRSGTSMIRVHAFEVTDQINTQGSFICTKHVIVKFVLDGVTNLSLNGFNHQNVISGLFLRQTGEGYELRLEPCYVLEGTITADHVHVEFEPGLPSDSQYLKVAGQ